METALIWNRLWHKTTGAQKASNATKDVTLPPRTVWSVTLQAGDCVTCERGLVWLTQSGDTNDYILRTGESFTGQGNGLVVVQALADSRLRIASTTEKATSL